mmetsp:Transcript_52814/g.106047  ORF Transcript_52814/g.106047 Transcript_52814/m.106047 type:complete len:158 (+) Transcript_52814:104-577(+)
MMAAGVLVALLGYLAIYKAHYPQGMFFGYDFKHGQWKEWKRIAHGWIGYLALILACFQASTGLLKLSSLQRGRRTLTFHGSLGKIVLALGATCVLLAVGFWTAWGPGLRFVVAAGAACAAALSVLAAPGRAAAGPEEELEETEEESSASGEKSSFVE